MHRESNEPVFQREMSLIGEKGDRAANESPNGEESQLQVDPEQANLVSITQPNVFSTWRRKPSKKWSRKSTSSSAETPWKLNEAQGTYKLGGRLLGNQLRSDDWNGARSVSTKTSTVSH